MAFVVTVDGETHCLDQTEEMLNHLWDDEVDLKNITKERLLSVAIFLCKAAKQNIQN